MTNTKELRIAIERSGYRIYFIAQNLGLTYTGFQKKVNGESEFKATEISKLSKLLKLSVAERDRIFFA